MPVRAALCALVGLSALSATSCRPRVAPSTLESVDVAVGESLVPPDVIAALEQVESVRALRLAGGASAESRDAIDGYAVSAEGAGGGSELAIELRRLFLAGDTFEKKARSKRCFFNPGVAYAMKNGEATYTALVCFECNQVRLLWTDPATGERTSATGDFDARRVDYVAAARKSFPNDEAIKELR